MINPLHFLRKCVKTCTQHPIINFVSFDHSLPIYRAFVSNIDQVQIPSNIQEALQDPNWKVATFDEIRAIEKNDTWQVTEIPPGKLLDASGFSY